MYRHKFWKAASALMSHGDRKSKQNIATDLYTVTHNPNLSPVFHLSLGFWHREKD